MRLTTFAITFGEIFLAELPDKSLFAALVLGTRYRPAYVWVGVAAAFLVHVVMAVTAGGLLPLLPHRLLQAVVAALFIIGAAIMLGPELRDDPQAEESATRTAPVPPTFLRVAVVSFVVVFIGEWGDITQIATANLAAKYGQPVPVLVGTTLALWAIAGLAVTTGRTILDYVSLRLVRRVGADILLFFAVTSTVTVLRG